MRNNNSNNQDVEPRKPKRSSGSIWFPIVLILLGIFFLLQEFGDFSFDNWWALFILIPALSAFGSAFGLWQKNGRFTFSVWSTFYGGLFPLLVALMFLFNLDWGDYWPLFVILGGFGMFVGGFPFNRPEDQKTPGVMLAHRPWMVFVGLSATLLGLTFLAFNLDWIETFPFFDYENWWGIFVLIPALGGLVTALFLLLRRYSIILAAINLGVSAMIAFTGIVILYNLDWKLINLAAAITLILVGLGIIVSVSTRKREDQST
jgi:hypothetical protein